MKVTIKVELMKEGCFLTVQTVSDCTEDSCMSCMIGEVQIKFIIIITTLSLV